MLLNAVKDVASSLYNLLDSAKNSSGRHGDGAGEDLKHSAKVKGIFCNFFLHWKC